MQKFLKKQHEDESDHYQCQQQFDDGQLTMLPSNDDIDQDIDHNDNYDHDIIDDNELTRNNGDFLLEIENCIN